MHTPKTEDKSDSAHFCCIQNSCSLSSLCSAAPDAEQIDRKDYYGKTPLYWAAYKGQRSSMELLLTHGANVNSRCKHGGTPLHAAVGLFPDCALVLIQVRPPRSRVHPPFVCTVPLTFTR